MAFPTLTITSNLLFIHTHRTPTSSSLSRICIDNDDLSTKNQNFITAKVDFNIQSLIDINYQVYNQHPHKCPTPLHFNTHTHKKNCSDKTFKVIQHWIRPFDSVQRYAETTMPTITLKYVRQTHTQWSHTSHDPCTLPTNTLPPLFSSTTWREHNFHNFVTLSWIRSLSKTK